MQLLELHLATACLPALAHFYGQVLGLPTRLTATALTVQVGTARLEWRPAAAGTAPFYHLAFTIPANQLPAARQWLGQRVALLPVGPGQEVVDFPAWQAQAVYFQDPAGSILELIARQPLRNNSSEPFGPGSWQGLSEVGVVAPEVPALQAELARTAGVPAFARGPVRPDFAALGTDEGLLIVVPPGRGWLPTGRPAEMHPLRVRYRQNGQEQLLIR